MGWFINIALLASIAVLSAAQDTDPRPKRDLSLIKDLFSGNLFGHKNNAPIVLGENTKIYKVEGLKEVVVKAVPKAKVKVELPKIQVHESVIVREDPRIALVNSYLGTKSLNETLLALQDIKTLLDSGVLHTQEEINNVVPPIIFGGNTLNTDLHTYSDFHHYNIPQPSYVLSTKKECCKSVKFADQSSVVSQGDKKKFVVTESKEPNQLYSHEASHLEAQVPKLDVNQSPIHFYDMPNIPVHPYMPSKVAPVEFAMQNGYQNIFSDGIIKTYTRPFDMNGKSDDNGAQETNKPVILPTYILDRNENIAAYDHNVKFPVLVNETPSIYPLAYMPQGLDYTYEHPKKENKVIFGENIGANIDHSDVPFGYSYTTIHKDGTQTSYSNSDVIKHHVQSNLETSAVDKHHKEKNILVVQNVEKAQPLPGYIAGRIENAAAQAYKVKFPTSTVTNSAIYYPPGYQVAILGHDHVHKPSIEEVKVNIGGYHTGSTGFSRIPSEHSHTTIHKEVSGYSEIPSEYSYTRVHNNGISGLTKIPSVYSYATEHKNDTANYSKISSGYSYTTIHKDGTKTSHSNLGTIKYNATNFIDENNVDKNQGGHTTKVVVTQEEEKPMPLPSFIANRIEKAAATAVNVKTPRPTKVDETVYVTPVPVYESVHPVLIQTPPKEVNVGFEGYIENTGTSKVPSQYSYTTVHKDGSVTAYSDAGLVKESQQINILKDIEKRKEHYHGSYWCDDNSHVEDTSLHSNLFGQSHVNIPSTVTVTPILLETNNDRHQKVVFPKPVISQYTYKQINNNTPNKFTVVPVGENGIINDHIRGDHNVNVTPYPYVNGASVSTDYALIPSKKPIKTVSDFSFEHVSESEDFNNKVTTTASHSVLVSPSKLQENVTSSDNSLNANPIVVLPDEPTFSYKQEKMDGSSVKIVGDKNIVSVIQQSTTESPVHRGDIPDIVL